MVEKHYINRVGWLRAAVLGANDGILSTTSLVIGVAAASTDRNIVVLSAISGLMAGAMSMAAGEYISVSSQLETEKADIAREKQELLEMPDEELNELAEIYQQRGLSAELARQVAIELTRHDALEAHLRDELGMTEVSAAKPIQAAFASFASFIAGAALPTAVAIFVPLAHMVVLQYVFSMLFLVLLGAIAAKTGGAPILRSIIKICFWGTVAMAATALVGYLFGTHLA